MDADVNHAMLDHDQMEREIVQGEGEHLVWINHAVDNVAFKARLTPPPAAEKVKTENMPLRLREQIQVAKTRVQATQRPYLFHPSLFNLFFLPKNMTDVHSFFRTVRIPSTLP